MISIELGTQVMKVNVMTSDEGGLSSEQITELAMDKILHVLPIVCNDALH